MINNGMNEHNKICPRCGKEFTVICRESEIYNPKKARTYCSDACSRARILSDATKQKISNSVKLLNPPIIRPAINCKCCGLSFIPTRNKQVMCSVQCVYIVNGKKMNDGSVLDRKNNPKKYSDLQKQLDANGIQKVGGGKTKWYTYKNIRVQGTYELRCCIILDKMKSMNCIYNWEYTKDRIPYIGIDGKSHSYLLDFKVYNSQTEFYYIEVKGFVKEVDFLKWKAVDDNGFSMEIWYKNNLESYESKYSIPIDEYRQYTK